jgi:hypothetical protein
MNLATGQAGVGSRFDLYLMFAFLRNFHLSLVSPQYGSPSLVQNMGFAGEKNLGLPTQLSDKTLTESEIVCGESTDFNQEQEGNKERRKDGKKDRRKEGKTKRRKEGKKERRKEGKKERRKEGKKERR